jgi:hypothetical protein
MSGRGVSEGVVREIGTKEARGRHFEEGMLRGALILEICFLIQRRGLRIL